jgi:decaprenyl-phosphate phosphoribosyltransferase
MTSPPSVTAVPPAASAAADPAEVSHQRAVAAGLVAAARPRQWVKQVLLLAAPAAAGVVSARDVLDTAIGIVTFTAAAAGTYLINDVLDVEADRLHPRKRLRPFASGQVPLRLGWVAGVTLMVLGIAGASILQPRLGGVVAVYVALTLSYSLWLKRVAIIELVVVALGFVLRALAGAEAVNVSISEWFVIVASFGSLFIVAGKRYVEATTLADGGVATRAILSEYPLAWLRQVRDVCVGVTLLAYCLFAFEKGQGVGLTLPWYQLSIVPVTIGLFRYSLQLERGLGEAPEELILHDRTLQLAGVAWAILFALGVGRV